MENFFEVDEDSTFNLYNGKRHEFLKLLEELKNDLTWDDWGFLGKEFAELSEKCYNMQKEIGTKLGIHIET